APSFIPRESSTPPRVLSGGPHKATAPFLSPIVRLVLSHAQHSAIAPTSTRRSRRARSLVPRFASMLQMTQARRAPPQALRRCHRRQFRPRPCRIPATLQRFNGLHEVTRFEVRAFHGCPANELEVRTCKR